MDFTSLSSRGAILRAGTLYIPLRPPDSRRTTGRIESPLAPRRSIPGRKAFLHEHAAKPSTRLNRRNASSIFPGESSPRHAFHLRLVDYPGETTFPHRYRLSRRRLLPLPSSPTETGVSIPAREKRRLASGSITQPCLPRHRRILFISCLPSLEPPQGFGHLHGFFDRTGHRQTVELESLDEHVVFIHMGT